MGRRSVAGMLKLVRSIISVLSLRFRSRAVLELEILALRHQLPFFVANDQSRSETTPLGRSEKLATLHLPVPK